MAEVVRLPQPKTGPISESLRSNSQAAMAAAAAPRATLQQAIDATLRLMRNWDRKKSDDALDAIVDVFLHFPLPIVHECADTWYGIASSKTQSGKVREWPPEAPEVRDWCEQLFCHCWKLAKSPRSQPRAEPEKPAPPPSAEDVARVWARVNEVRESAKRVLGEPTLEERRDAAERILKAAARATQPPADQ